MLTSSNAKHKLTLKTALFAPLLTWQVPFWLGLDTLSWSHVSQLLPHSSSSDSCHFFWNLLILTFCCHFTFWFFILDILLSRIFEDILTRTLCCLTVRVLTSGHSAASLFSDFLTMDTVVTQIFRFLTMDTTLPLHCQIFCLCGDHASF